MKTAKETSHKITEIKIKRDTFSLLSDVDVENDVDVDVFNEELKSVINNFKFFSFSLAHLPKQLLADVLQIRFC